MSKVHPSVHELSEIYFDSIGQPKRDLLSFYFCDNEKDANECADLVLRNIKRATASSLKGIELNNEEMPSVGDHYIVTDWQGIALCVIQVEKVEITPLNQISPEFAEIEGEGDKSLEYWKRVHWDFYHREFADTEYTPTEDMLIVCEQFKVIFTAVDQ